MRILVAGSRSWSRPWMIAQDLAVYAAGCPKPKVVVVHGACPTGADDWADKIAVGEGYSVERHPADWRAHGRAAGPLRNAAMVKLGADVCLAYLKDHSAGATHTADLAEAAGIPTKRRYDCACHTSTGDPR